MKKKLNYNNKMLMLMLILIHKPRVAYLINLWHYKLKGAPCKVDRIKSFYLVWVSKSWLQ